MRRTLMIELNNFKNLKDVTVVFKGLFGKGV